ncbi:cadherin-related family member 4 [Discoglossus pictus]
MGSAPLVVPWIYLLLIQVASGQEFGGLPETVSLPENSPIGTLVYNFTLDNCTSAASVTLHSVIPATDFFNPPALSGSGSEYKVEITLSSSALLNAQIVNQYTLDFTGACGPDLAVGQLFVRITDVPQPQCEPRFASQVGETVQVYANIPASSPIYKVVLREPKYTPVTYKITEPVPSIFTIFANGDVKAPSTGFANADATYQLQILVTDSLGNSCNGTLTIQVLHVDDTTVNFTVASTAVTIKENGGPNFYVTRLQAQGKDIMYEMITPNTAYYINPDTGEIRTTYNLDLDRTPSMAFTIVQFRAYNKYQRTSSAIASVNITVLDVNDLAPECNPAVFVTQVPETTPIGKILASFSCKDPDVNSTALTYTVTPNANSLYSFRMQGSDLVINKTLTYDSAEMASVNFQYAATIVVTDKGTPAMTTNIPVFVTVTPVNNYPPKCNGPTSFSVRETATFGTVVGTLNATDADYKFNNVEYSIEGNPTPPVFYINPRSGEIHLLSTLDYEKVTSYTLNVKVVDLNNDIIPDPTNQKTTYCSITINVQDVNDNPPVCTPPYYSTQIYSTLSVSSDVKQLTCTDPDITSDPLYYTIVGGNINSRFTMSNDAIRHNPFSYNPDGVFDPLTFELLVKVTDSLTPPIYSTTATVIVNVVPWTTTQPTTTTSTTTPEQQTQIVHKTLTYWAPEMWFIVVLTLTGALLLTALGLLAWRLRTGSPICCPGSKEGTQPLLQDRSLADTQPPTEEAKQQQTQQNKEKKDMAPMSPLSLQFDGRAQDPVTGREYLFNSHTGERRWL